MATSVFLNLYGVGGATSHHPRRGSMSLQSVAWGFELTPGAGTFEYGSPIIPSALTATMVSSGQESPQLMNRMLTQQVSTTGVIRVNQPNVAGEQTVVATITLHHVHVVEFRQHLDGEESVDTVQLIFSGLDYDYPPGPTATYALPT